MKATADGVLHEFKREDLIPAAHIIITDTCRLAGDETCFETALDRGVLQAAYKDLTVKWPQGTGAKIHLTLSVEKPPPVSIPGEDATGDRRTADLYGDCRKVINQLYMGTPRRLSGAEYGRLATVIRQAQEAKD